MTLISRVTSECYILLRIRASPRVILDWIITFLSSMLEVALF